MAPTKAELEAQLAADQLKQAQEAKLRKLHRETRVPDPAKVAQLPSRRKNKQTGQWEDGKPLDYLGHADVTDLLLVHDPHWNWEPVAWTDQGLPGIVKDAQGWPVGLWIRLTIHGVTRLGYGNCAPGKDDAVKELIGDAIRNAALRFGVALQLWSKADKDGWEDLPEAGPGDDAPTPPQDAPATPDAPKDAPAPAAPEKPAQPTQAKPSGQCPECHGPGGRHASSCSRKGAAAHGNGTTAVNEPLTPAAPAEPVPAADPEPAAEPAAEHLSRDQLDLEVGRRVAAMRGPTAIAYAEEKTRRGWPGDLTTADDDTMRAILAWLQSSPTERVVAGS